MLEKPEETLHELLLPCSLLCLQSAPVRAGLSPEPLPFPQVTPSTRAVWWPAYQCLDILFSLAVSRSLVIRSTATLYTSHSQPGVCDPYWG